MPASLYLGVDIGGTKTAVALVAENGSIVYIDQTPTPVNPGGVEILENAVALAKKICAKLDKNARLLGIGIGAGGQINAETGVVVSATDILPGWAGIRIREGFQYAFESVSNIAVDNDVNAFASGEWKFGAARGAKNALFLALGTGVGGAAIVDGRLLRGAHHSGAEFGHILFIIPEDDRHDRQGYRGSLEAYVSGPGLVSTWREIAGSHDDEVTGRYITGEAKANPSGDCGTAVTRTGTYLGYGLASLANVFDPEIIVIGGGLASLGDMLLDPARNILKKYALPGPRSANVVTALLGANSSVVGAASLSMHES
jgi:glucokinase